MSLRELQFTDRSVRAARYVGCQPDVEYRFRNLAGLVLHISKRGRKTWKAHYSIQKDGVRKKRKVRLGQYPATTLVQARKKSAELLERVANEGDVVANDGLLLAAQAKGKLTFAELLDDYLAERRGLARIGEAERELRKDAIPALGAKHPALITAGDIDEVGRAILRRGSEAMASRFVMHMKALYNYVILDQPSLAQRYGITSNPAVMLGRRRRGAGGSYTKPKARERVLDDPEIAKWWRALDDSEKRLGTKLALKLVLVTAQRPGEVRRARKQDLHLTAAEPYWMIPVEHSKNGRQHYVPLSHLAAQLFTEAAAASSDSGSLLVFPSPDDAENPIADVVLPSAQRDFFVKTLKSMTPATVHDLRRSAATGMRRLGINRDTVGMVLNHTAKGVTAEHYDWHDGAREKWEALDRWARHLSRLVK
ncbi:site-specific integrase [Hyphomicrobium sp.]|uniref:tyrosine-type recombinase/integrase n=1 Tax=Hyphomicrobium sp. TaxID=82 RepID=UPI001D580590|nr:site-specific integrase [Hyphomicrobium sp.]MBY0559340.1 tyrosine-type recombinase/integrase [Hyphomicrobium sp.]